MGINLLGCITFSSLFLWEGQQVNIHSSSNHHMQLLKRSLKFLLNKLCMPGSFDAKSGAKG